MKKSIHVVGLTPSEQRRIVEALRTEYSVRLICGVLGFNKSTLYYLPKSDPSEENLRTEIEQLAVGYPTYGYRRITELLVRLMKSENLCVSVKRVCRTTTSLRVLHPYVNRLQMLEVSRADQV